jgi:drug/metabolite transporter (DMT)-like permease
MDWKERLSWIILWIIIPITAGIIASVTKGGLEFGRFLEFVFSIIFFLVIFYLYFLKRKKETQITFNEYLLDSLKKFVKSIYLVIIIFGIIFPIGLVISGTLGGILLIISLIGMFFSFGYVFYKERGVKGLILYIIIIIFVIIMVFFASQID